MIRLLKNCNISVCDNYRSDYMTDIMKGHTLLTMVRTLRYQFVKFLRQLFISFKRVILCDGNEIFIS